VVRSVRVCDNSELSVIPSISMVLSNITQSTSQTWRYLLHGRHFVQKPPGVDVAGVICRIRM
jgi:hypothetical protein